jgi:hypothetical protein
MQLRRFRLLPPLLAVGVTVWALTSVWSVVVTAQVGRAISTLKESAPFDHPALCVPVGHVEAAPGVLRPDTSADGSRADAADVWALVPAVGRGGHFAPLQTFQEQLLGLGRDGTRAHTLDRACAP